MMFKLIKYSSAFIKTPTKEENDLFVDDNIK